MQYSCMSSRLSFPASLGAAVTGILSGMSNSAHRRQTGSRLRIAIESLGKTQVEICNAFGVSPPKLGNWLRGDHYPDPYFIARFCNRYNITADWIYRNQAGGVAGALGDALWEAAKAFESVPVAEERPAPAPSKTKPAKRRGRPRKISAG